MNGKNGNCILILLTSLALLYGLIYGPNSEEHFNTVFNDIMSEMFPKLKSSSSTNNNFLSRYDEPEGLVVYSRLKLEN